MENKWISFHLFPTFCCILFPNKYIHCIAFRSIEWKHWIPHKTFNTFFHWPISTARSYVCDYLFGSARIWGRKLWTTLTTWTKFGERPLEFVNLRQIKRQKMCISKIMKKFNHNCANSMANELVQWSFFILSVWKYETWGVSE